MNLLTFKEAFDIQSQAYEEIINSFTKQNKTTTYPIANVVLQRYSVNLSLIIQSMFDSAKNDNLYACSILYRSFIEHFFKAFYIFEKTLSDKDDDVAKSFQKHYLISEFLAEKAGVLEMEDI